MRKQLLLLTLPFLTLFSCEPKPLSGDFSITYEDDGGAEIPSSFNEEDNESTVRKATYTIDNQSFSVEFVGMWCINTSHGEYQTMKTPTSYIRSASSIQVKKMVVEVFMAEVEIYSTKDHSGEKITGTEVEAAHEDGTAYSYELNSENWSILPVETYKGSKINFYSLTFYF